jgi:hypothetical protein
VTRYGPRVVEAKTLSEAWLETVLVVVRQPGQAMFHTVTTIQCPPAEDQALRDRCDALASATGKKDISEVANTIFPAAMASLTPEPADLVARYRAAYPTIRRFPGNHRGTYFGRLVCYPGQRGDIDQLCPLIDKLRRESTNDRPKSVRYEVNLQEAGDADPVREDTAPEEHDEEPVQKGNDSSVAAIIRGERDNSPMGFPCLSMYSFQLDHGRVHLLAHYRYEYLIARGYGNYLGLTRLLGYVAGSAGLEVGQLTVVTGRAKVDVGKKNLSKYLDASLFDSADLP